jgi:hypothetical protein
MERAFNRALFSSLLQSVEQNFWLTFSGQGTRNIQIIGNPPRSGVLPYLNARDCRRVLDHGLVGSLRLGGCRPSQRPGLRDQFRRRYKMRQKRCLRPQMALAGQW